jgi:SecD/SecF fusion protein
MSAIIDANVTTFFVGIILYSFGIGPIKGFAVTLMAGIAASLFSAIVITRVVIDYLTREKTAKLSFG